MTNIKAVKATLSPLWTVAYNLFLLLVICTLSRLLFIGANIDHFPTLEINHLVEMCWGGIRFDISALMYVMGLFYTPYWVACLSLPTVLTPCIFLLQANGLPAPFSQKWEMKAI